MPEPSKVAMYDDRIVLEKDDPKAKYRAAGDKDSQCGDCRFFNPAWRSCSLVEGTIESSYTCNLWTAKLPSQDGGRLYSEQEVQLFQELSPKFFKDLSKPTWIPFLPKPGMFKHPLYGEIEITEARNKEFVKNYKDGVYQEHIPIDAEHETKLSGAVAWLKDMRVNDDGSADGYVEWTERGQKLAGGDTPQFKYFSPEWFDTWTDPKDGKVYNNVIAGGAITTRPFFKDKVLRALVASEQGAEVVAAEEASMKKCADCGKMYSSTAKACPTCGSTKVATEDKNVPDSKDLKISVTLSEEDQAKIDAAIAKAVEDAKTGLFSEEQVKAREQAAAEAAKTAAEGDKDNAPKDFKETQEYKTLTEQSAELKRANEALQASLKTITDADRRRRFSDLVSGIGGANDGGSWVGDKDKHVAFLEKLAEKVGETDEMFVAHVEQQNAIAAQARESNLFSQSGTGAPAPAGGAQDRLDSLARKAMEAASAAGKPISFSEASSQVLTTEEGARLYAELSRTAPRNVGS